MSTRRAFILAVENEMARQGIERKELARRLGCTMQNVEQALDSECTASMKLVTAEKLAAALKCGLSLFLIPNSLAKDNSPELLQGSLPLQPKPPVCAFGAHRHRWEDAALHEGLPLSEWMALAAELAWNLFHREQPQVSGGSYSPLTTAFWVMQGLSPKAAHALSLARIKTWEHLQELSLSDLSRLPELGPVNVRHVEALLNRHLQGIYSGPDPLDTAIDRTSGRACPLIQSTLELHCPGATK